MSMNRTCAISSWISFLTSAGIPIYLDMYATEETSQQRSRPSRSIIWDRAEQLAHCHPIHLFFVDSTVTVVQRKERRFPNPRYSPSQEGIASPEAAQKRQDQPVGDNYLATNGDGMEWHARVCFTAWRRSRGEN